MDKREGDPARRTSHACAVQRNAKRLEHAKSSGPSPAVRYCVSTWFGRTAAGGADVLRRARRGWMHVCFDIPPPDKQLFFYFLQFAVHKGLLYREL
jgi:hypothetical protein